MPETTDIGLFSWFGKGFQSASMVVYARRVEICSFQWSILLVMRRMCTGEFRGDIEERRPVPGKRFCNVRVPGSAKHFVTVLLLLIGAWGLAQGQNGPDSSGFATDARCMRCTVGGIATGMTGTIFLLDKAWYADHQRAPLHNFNDGAEWLQMDKAGHAFSAYTLGAWGHQLLDRCDPGSRKGLWYGSATGLVFLTAVEVLDGTSEAWGFSWWDIAANVSGFGLYTGQELAWGEQRLRLKLSARHTEYAAMRPGLLGESGVERYLKDYNGHTIWLSANLHSFMPNSKFPTWLNLAFGYGADGMITAFEPDGPEAIGADLLRQRRFFLAPDIDLTRIPTKSKALRTVLFVLNSIKIPMPTLEVNDSGRIQGHWLYF